MQGETPAFVEFLDRSVSVALPLGFSLVVAAVLVDFAATRGRRVLRRSPCAVATASMAGFCALMYPLVHFGIGFLKSASATILTVAAVAGLLLFVLGTVVNIAARFRLGLGWSDRIAVYEGQRLVSGGLYSLVRHPLYASLVLMLLGVGLIYVNALVLALTTLVLLPLLVHRARREEEVLLGGLTGYADYRARVPMFLPFAKPRSPDPESQRMQIDWNALRFCRIGTVLLLIAALISRERLLVLATFVIMLVPALSTIRAAPLYALYSFTLGALVKKRERAVDRASIRFAQGLGSTLLALALFCLYGLNSRYAGWILAGTVAVSTAFGAGGLCLGAWIHQRLVKLAGLDA